MVQRSGLSTSWRSGDAGLVAPVDARLPLQPDWWQAFHDPVLDQLETRAFAASTDLRKAALHFAQARVQRSTVAAQRWPEVGASASANRQRASESSASTRIAQGLGPQKDELIDLLSQPFDLYQAGFDASWEPDLWGRVRRSVEAADADVAQQAALLDAARLGVAGEVARNYFLLRTNQRQLRLSRDDIAAMEQRLTLIEARVRAGTLDHLGLERQRAELSGLQAQLPGLMAQAAAYENQLGLLLGEHPGALHELLRPAPDGKWTMPPDLAPGQGLERAQAQKLGRRQGRVQTVQRLRLVQGALVQHGGEAGGDGVAQTIARRIEDKGGDVERLQQRLGRLTMPVLGVWCHDDRITDISALDSLRNGLTAASAISTSTISGCNHMPMLEKPDTTAQILTGFALSH